MLLAVAGGSLDAFLYLNHGKVFAAAVTGNVVLAGIGLLSHDTRATENHLVPLASFLVGLWVASWLGEKLGRRAVRVGLIAEMVGLVVASLARGVPEHLYVACIAVLVAYQIRTFRQVDEFTYNSTFITSNLRTMMDGLYEAMEPKRRCGGLRKARELGRKSFEF